MGIKRLQKYQKINIIIIGITLFVILLFSVGYSLLSTQLGVNSTVTVRSIKNVRITDISTPTFTNGASEVYNSRYTEKTVTNNIELSSLTSTVSYTITITNSSDTNYDIKSIETDVFNNDNMTYTLTDLALKTLIPANNSVTFTITYAYKSTVQTLPSTTTLGSILHLEFEEYQDTSLQYAQGSMILNLKGTDAPSNGAWVDTENNHSFTLSNVSYDASNKFYSFGTNGYATLSAPLIPATGDFTLEAYIYTPASTSTDQAIVAQVSDTSNDSGRFKLNLINSNLITFVNTQTSGSKSLYFASGVTASTKYLLQLVRTGGSYKQYINGSLVRTTSIAATNTISQGPLKLARWTNAANQHYAGSIYAVRLYNRALTDSELSNNYDVDANTYQSVSSEKQLYAYVTSNQVVTSGDGLYNTATGTYLYKGAPSDNYIKFASSSDVYRIIGYYSDGTAKIVNTSGQNYAFDASGNHSAETSSYCTSASTLVSTGLYYGCNAWAGNGTTVIGDSTAKTYIDSWYNNLAESISSKIVEHAFEVGVVNAGQTYQEAITSASTATFTGHVGLLTVPDVINASVSQIGTFSTTNSMSNYLVSLADSSSEIWTMTPTSEDTFNEWSVAYGTALGIRRSSRNDQINGGKTALFYVNPAFYISSSTTVTGTGAPGDPFIIVQN